MLPAYLQALAARLVVLRARARTAAEFRATEALTGEINGYIVFLQGIWSRIHGAIRKSDVNPVPQADRDKPVWGGGYMTTVGAVEIYTGLHDWTWFESFLQPVPPATLGQMYDQYVAEREASYQRLYDALGLDDLMQIIDRLRDALVDHGDTATGANVAATAGPSSSSTISRTSTSPSPVRTASCTSSGSPTRPRRGSGTAPARPGLHDERHAAVMTWFGGDGARRPYVFVAAPSSPGSGTAASPVRKGALFTYWWTGSQWQSASQGNMSEHVMSATRRPRRSSRTGCPRCGATSSPATSSWPIAGRGASGSG